MAPLTASGRRSGLGGSYGGDDARHASRSSQLCSQLMPSWHQGSFSTQPKPSLSRTHPPVTERSLQFSARKRGSADTTSPKASVTGSYFTGPPAQKVTSTKAAWECVPFLVKWINYLCGGLGWTPLTVDRFFDDLRSGLVLCRIVERLVPSEDFSVGLNLRPKSQKPCIANIDRALTVVWKQGVHASQMCTAADVYEGSVRKVVCCLVEIFEVLQMRLRELRVKARENIHAMNTVLCRIGRGLSEQTLADPVGFSQQLLADFADGARIMALLVAFGKASPDDAAQLRGCCVLQDHWRINASITNRALAIAGCPVMLAPAEWTSPPAPFPDTLLYQLHTIWTFLLRNQQDTMVGQAKMETREEAMTNFLEFLLQRYPNVETACYEFTGPKHNRLSQSNFIRILKQLEYPWDAKFIWHCLDKSSQGFITVYEFFELERLVRDAGDLHTTPLPAQYSRGSEPGGGYGPFAEAQFSQHLDASDDQLEPDAATQAGGHNFDSANFSFSSVGRHRRPHIQLLVDFPLEAGEEWPQPSLPALVAATGGRQVRLPGYAEERAWLYDEDERRQMELYEQGAIVVARRVAGGADAGAKAIIDASDELHLNDRSIAGDEEEDDLGPTPTTSIQARVVWSDRSEQVMWLQTSVIDRVDDEDQDVDPDATMLVLELREPCSSMEQGIGSPDAKLIAQIDVELIASVEQLGPSDLTAGFSADVSFIVVMMPGADLRGPRPKYLDSRSLGPGCLSPAELRKQTVGNRVLQQSDGPSHFHKGSEDTQLLCILAGPTPWKRREAAKFFDELRILSHFLKAGEFSQTKLLDDPDSESEEDEEDEEEAFMNSSQDRKTLADVGGGLDTLFQGFAAGP
eukprot:TRINITY_DN25750_c0_g1_i1.p1 TRINITY_DN25750_c0_g1~~TRINITY_DN25750_c0_g1_i1.p1  ORF type:complete len:858 (-),score=156.32 TRINITY_DN25750_c0_g1_i1:202-2775(-)